MKTSYLIMVSTCFTTMIFLPRNLHAENCTITHTIKSETVAKSPTDKARKKLGIGEDVTLTLLGGHKATWKIGGTGEGRGKINGGTDPVPGKNSVKYTAPDDPTAEGSPVKITATCEEEGGKSVDISFTVVAPDGVKMEVVDATLVKQTDPYFKISYQTETYILPNDVNFQNVKFKEGGGNAVADGYFLTQNGTPHKPVDEWDSGYTHVEGKGTQLLIRDSIIMSAPFTPYSSNGKFTWPIPYLYKINGDEKGELKKVDQIKEIALASGSTMVTFSTKKAGADAEVTADKP